MKNGSLIVLAGLCLLAGVHGHQTPAATDADPPAIAERKVSAAASLNPLVDLMREKRKTEARIRAGLSRQINLHFEEIPLADALEQLEELAGATIHVNMPMLREEGVRVDDAVSLSAKNITLHQAFVQTLEPLGLDYLVEDEVIEITTIIDREERLESRHYEISDLLEWEAAHRFTELHALPNTLRSTHRVANELLSLIEWETRGPWLEIDGTGGELAVHGRLLSVRQTEAVQNEIPPILKLLRLFINGGFGKDRSVFLQSLSKLDNDLEARRALAKRVSFDFLDKPLDEIAKHLTKQMDVPIVIDEQALIEEGVPKDEPLTIRVKDVTLDKGLELMLERLGLEAVISNGSISLTTIIAAEEMLCTVAYDVRDLLQSGAIRREFFLDKLWTHTSGPWVEVDGMGGRVSEPLPGLLIIRQTEDGQKEVAALFADIRDEERKQTAKGLPPTEIELPPPDKVLIEFYNLRRVNKPRQIQKAIYEIVVPKSWEAHGGEGTICIVNDLLIIKNTAKVQREVHGFLLRLNSTLEENALNLIDPLPGPFGGNSANFSGFGNSGF